MVEDGQWCLQTVQAALCGNFLEPSSRRQHDCLQCPYSRKVVIHPAGRAAADRAAAAQDLAQRCYGMNECNGFVFQPDTKTANASGWLKAGKIDRTCTSISPFLTTYALNERPYIAPVPPPSSGHSTGAIVGGDPPVCAQDGHALTQAAAIIASAASQPHYFSSHVSRPRPSTRRCLTKLWDGPHFQKPCTDYPSAPQPAQHP